ncbi:MAG: FHA domain-containing protein [Clostridiales bacterium]|jgi:pSer/pThr/pTyr-binding forkhead associated (FHA) protein|nr:FHA domain-containing protein [Clostridiales bacterium]MDR2749875.1 FHA domain-containing protein [Clostridiales bacterium]
MGIKEMLSKLFLNNDFDERALSQTAVKKLNPFLQLEIHAPNAAKWTKSVSKFPCIVGRSKEKADVVCPDRKVSHEHMAIDFLEDEGEYKISDLGTPNGIIIAGIQLPPRSPRTLYLGDILILGDTEIKVTRLDK